LTIQTVSSRSWIESTHPIASQAETVSLLAGELFTTGGAGIGCQGTDQPDDPLQILLRDCSKILFDNKGWGSGLEKSVFVTCGGKRL
jgi:hypothetical protein